MSSRPVDIRSKELDNTAVPLLFEIYATIKTSKYREIEAAIHKLLTNLADARIRKGREFFNIRPEEALKHLKDLALLTGDAEISAPDDFDSKDGSDRKYSYKGRYTVNTGEIFHLENGVANARMRVLDGNRYTVRFGWERRSCIRRQLAQCKQAGMAASPLAQWNGRRAHGA